MDQKLDVLTEPPSTPPSTPFEKNMLKVPDTLVSRDGKFIVGDFGEPPSPMLGDHDEQEMWRRRAWARSSLGGKKVLGKSYSVHSMDKVAKLTLPVMSKKRSRRDAVFKNVDVLEVGRIRQFLTLSDLVIY